MKRSIDKIVKTGGRVAALLGQAHTAWRTYMEFRPWDEIREMPVARYLVDDYGKDKVGLVSLIDCSDPYNFVCFPGPKNGLTK